MKPIPKSRVGDQVFEQIKEAILKGVWGPGTKMPSENELSEMLQVSRGPIREALRKLSAFGIIETRQGEGSFVRAVTVESMMNSFVPIMSLNKKNMMDILQYRQIIEGESAALAAENADDYDLSLMEQAIKELTDIGRPCIECSTADLAFHFYVAQATKNLLIAGVSSVIKDLMLKHYAKINELMGMESAIHYHHLIFEAIKRKDPETARALMNEHIKRSINETQTKYR